jgi:hypothetical protein
MLCVFPNGVASRSGGDPISYWPVRTPWIATPQERLAMTLGVDAPN